MGVAVSHWEGGRSVDAGLGIALVTTMEMSVVKARRMWGSVRDIMVVADPTQVLGGFLFGDEVAGDR